MEFWGDKSRSGYGDDRLCARVAVFIAISALNEPSNQGLNLKLNSGEPTELPKERQRRLGRLSMVLTGMTFCRPLF